MAENQNTERGYSKGNTHIISVCRVCDESETAPNKGLGRAKIAAWESRHQGDH